MSLIVTLLSGEEEVPLVVYPEENFHTVLARASELVGYEVDIKSLTTDDDVSLEDNVYQYFMKFESLIEEQTEEMQITEGDMDTQMEPILETEVASASVELVEPQNVIKIIEFSEDNVPTGIKYQTVMSEDMLPTIEARLPLPPDYSEEIDETRVIPWRVRNRVTCHFCHLKLSGMKNSTRSYILDEKNIPMLYQNVYNGTNMNSKLICSKCLENQYEKVTSNSDRLSEFDFIVISNNAKDVYREIGNSYKTKKSTRPTRNSSNQKEDGLVYTLVNQKNSKRSVSGFGAVDDDELRSNLVVRRKVTKDNSLLDETPNKRQKSEKRRAEPSNTPSELNKIDDKRKKSSSLVSNSDIICKSCGHQFSDLATVIEHCKVHQVNNRLNGIPCVLCLRNFKTFNILRRHVYGDHHNLQKNIKPSEDEGGYLDENSGSYVKNESGNAKKEEFVNEDETEDYLTDRLQKYLTGELDADTFFHQDYLRGESDENVIPSNIIDVDDDDDVIVWIVGDNDESDKGVPSDMTQPIDDSESNEILLNPEITNDIKAIDDDPETTVADDSQLYDSTLQESVEEDTNIDDEIETFQEIDYSEDPEYEPDDDLDSDAAQKRTRVKWSLGKYKCDVCNKCFNTKGKIDSHKCSGPPVIKEEDKKDLTCTICGESFLSKVRLQFHRQTHKEGGWQRMSCDRCPRKDFASEHELFDHMCFTHNKPFVCPYEGCDKTFKLRKLLKSHLRDHGVKKYGCHICGLRFHVHQTLKEHLVLHMKVKPYQCHICLKYMSKASRLRMHLLVHTSQQRPTDVLVCRLCDAAFKDAQEAEAHCDNPHECEPKEDDKDGIYDMALMDMENFNVNDIKSKTDSAIETEDTEESALSKQNLLMQLSDEARNMIMAVWIDKVFSCQYCEKVYYTKEALHQHRRLHYGIAEPYQCHLCEARFLTYARCTAHKSTHGYFKEGGAPSLRDFPVIKHYLCDICDKSNLLWTTVSVHYRHHHKQNMGKQTAFSCKNCHLLFATTWDLGKHRRLKHRKEVYESARAPNKVVNFAYKCTECDQELPTKSALTSHQKAAHSAETARNKHAGLLVCSECGKTYATKPALLTHIKWHTEHGIGKEAARRRKRAFGKGSHICSICGLGFYSAANLRAHIDRIHEKSYKYTCEECGKGHFTHMEMETHKLTHTGERPYKCPECPRAYVTKAILNKHFRNHTGERPYSCHMCGATFKTAHSRNYHKMKHENGKLPSPLIVLEVKGGNSKKLQAALHAANFQKDKEPKQRTVKHVSEVRDYIKEEMEEFQNVNEEEVLVRTTDEGEEIDDSMIAVHEETQEGVQIVYKRYIRSIDENGCENEYTIEYEESQ